MESPPLSRQMPCPACSPHEHHLFGCDNPDCLCSDPPLPGVYPIGGTE